MRRVKKGKIFFSYYSPSLEPGTAACRASCRAHRRRREGRFEIAANRSPACAALAHSAYGPGHRLPGAFMVAPSHDTTSKRGGTSIVTLISRDK